MYQRRRSTLGRRHMLGVATTQAVPSGISHEPSSARRPAITSSWRGRRSEKKKLNNLDRPSRELISKKRLFSPMIDFDGPRGTKEEERNQNRSYPDTENSLDVTGVTSITATPRTQIASSTFCVSAHHFKPELKTTLCGPFSSTSRVSKPLDKKYFLNDVLNKPISSYKIRPVETKRLEFDNLKPPESPGPSELDKLILEETVEFPVDPDLQNLQRQETECPVTHIHFSPPLSSTCIGSPDSGKKLNNDNFKSGTKICNNVLDSVEKCRSEKQLSIIQEDLDSSILEFEECERTVLNMDESHSHILNTTLKNVPCNNTCLEQVLDEHINQLNAKEKIDQPWKKVLSKVEAMELLVINNAKKNVQIFKMFHRQIETLQKSIENMKNIVEETEKMKMNMFKEDMENLSTVKKLLKELEIQKEVEKPFENKENLSPCISKCNKNHLDEENRWFKILKSENPSLLKTPKPNRNLNSSTILTPHSLSQVLHNQMTELHN